MRHSRILMLTSFFVMSLAAYAGNAMVTELPGHTEAESVRPSVKIIGGQITTARREWAVKILIFKLVDGRPALMGDCSGTAISKSYILTAAHCFVEDGIKLDPKKNTMQVVYSSDQNNRMDPNASTTRRIVDIKYPKAGDLALAKVDVEHEINDYPLLDNASLKLPRNAQNKLNVDKGTVYGYGLPGPNNEPVWDYGALYKKQIRFAGIAKYADKVFGGKRLLFWSDDQSIPVAEGDSGGPVFTYGMSRTVLVCVTSGKTTSETQDGRTITAAACTPVGSDGNASWIYRIAEPPANVREWALLSKHIEF